MDEEEMQKKENSQNREYGVERRIQNAHVNCENKNKHKTQLTKKVINFANIRIMYEKEKNISKLYTKDSFCVL